MDARKTNYGTRIDYILCSCCLAERVVSSEVWQHVKGSDHCPVFADFELSPRRSDRPLPPLCSMWFAGKQSRLLDFVTRSDKVEKKAEKRAVDPAPSVSAPPAKKKVLGQRSLFSFATSNSSKASTSATPTPEPSSAPNLSQGGGGGLSEAWKGVFGGAGPKAPLCSGHNEACVQRRVKKKGPNKDRQFWVCARPAGSKGDPQARCDFFKWAKEKKK